MNPIRRHVTLIGLLAVVVSTMCAGATGAEPKREATVDLRNGQVGVFGVVTFDVAGGAVTGAIRMLNVPYAANALLKLADGRLVPARLNANMTLTGGHGGGPLSSMEGRIALNGNVTRADTGCSATATGQGVWQGSMDALLGMLLIDAYWPALGYQGCGAAARDEFRMQLPRLRFIPFLGAPPPA